MENLDEIDVNREKYLVTAIKKGQNSIVKDKVKVIGGTLLCALGALGVGYFTPELMTQIRELDAITFNSVFLDNSVVAEYFLSILTLSYGAATTNFGFDKLEYETHSLRKHQNELEDFKAMKR